MVAAAVVARVQLFFQAQCPIPMSQWLPAMAQVVRTGLMVHRQQVVLVQAT